MPKNLLLADDSITIQKVVAITFAGEDVRITTVDNGEDAISRARELRPDVILADVVMPRRNGYEVCEAVKSDPTLQHIPVLLLAGTFEAFDEARARSARADGHIAKPFESQALINKVKELLGEKVAPPAPRPSLAGATAPRAAASAAAAPRAQPARPAVPGMPPADTRPSFGPPAAGRSTSAAGQGMPPRQPLAGIPAATRPPGAMGVPSVPRPAVPQGPRPASAAPVARAAGARATPAPLAPGLRAPKPPSGPAPALGSPRPVSPPLSAPRPAPIPTLQARPPSAAPQSSPSLAARRDAFGLDAPVLRPPATSSAPAPAGLAHPLPTAPPPAAPAATVGLAAKHNVAADIELDLAPAVAPATDADWSDVDLTDIDEEAAPSPAGPNEVAAAMSAVPQVAKAAPETAKAAPETAKAAPEPVKPALEPTAVSEPAAAAQIATLEEIDFGDAAGAPASSMDGKANVPAALEEIELTPLATPAPVADEPRTLAAQLEELPELDAEDAIELPPAPEAVPKVEEAQAPAVIPVAARALERPVPLGPDGAAPTPFKAPVPAPAAAPGLQADGGEAMLREALSRASREVIERIAWEVVPQLAETILREQIERLAKERQR